MRRADDHRRRSPARACLAVTAAGGLLLCLGSFTGRAVAAEGDSSPGKDPGTRAAEAPGPATPGAPGSTGAPAPGGTRTDRKIYRPLPPPPAGSAPPLLVVSEPVHHWGNAFKGQVIEHAFAIENRGGAPLVIQDVKGSCGCTVPNPADKAKTLAPGEKSTITLNVDTSSLKGTVEKYVDILSNGPGEENKLWMKGDVEEVLLFDPPVPQVNVVKKSFVPTEPLKVNVGVSQGRTVKIEELKSGKGLVKPTLREIEPGKKFELTLEPTLDSKEDKAFQADTLDTRIEVEGKKIELHMVVYVNLKDRIEVLPGKSVFFTKKDTMALTGSAAGAPVVKTIELVSTGGGPHRFKVEKAAAKAGIFAVKVKAAEEGKRYQLEISIPKAPEKQRYVRDVIEVHTDDPEVPDISFPAMAQF